MSFRMEGKELSHVLLSGVVILLFHLCQVTYGVKVLNVRVLSDNNNTYLFRDDRGVIFCDFELDNETEQLETVHWSKKGEVAEEFYVWVKGRRSQSPTGVFKGRINMKERNPKKLVINTANIEMHGTIQCEVKTNKGSDRGETTLTVIQDTCRESDWEFTFNKELCTETVHFKCSGFFPKPSFTCGLYKRGDQERYLTSFPMDSVAPRDKTFDMSVTRNFKASDFIEHENVVLLCEIFVYGAPYKFVIEREMFGERGCGKHYPDDLDVNTTIVTETCWKNPANGSVITYRCDSSEPMKTVMCVNGTWVDESEGAISDSFCAVADETSVLSGVGTELLLLLSAALMLFV